VRRLSSGVAREKSAHAAGDRGKERHLVAVAQNGVARGVLAVDGGGRRGGKTGEQGHFAGQRGPQLRDARPVGDLADLLIATGGVPEGREVH
jgi:hypothetical protein